jgi:hypothetical protein
MECHGGMLSADDIGVGPTTFVHLCESESRQGIAICQIEHHIPDGVELRSKPMRRTTESFNGDQHIGIQ